MTIAAYYNAPPGNEENIRRIVASVGPVAVAVDASQWGFEHYSSGIYSDFKCNSNKLNHAVIVVGYGTENGRDYWLIKNRYSPLIIFTFDCQYILILYMFIYFC